MKVETTAGVYFALQADNDPDTLVVTAADAPTLQILLDGVEMLSGLESPGYVEMATIFAAAIPREAFARWLAFEVTEYLNYGPDGWASR